MPVMENEVDSSTLAGGKSSRAGPSSQTRDFSTPFSSRAGPSPPLVRAFGAVPPLRWPVFSPEPFLGRLPPLLLPQRAIKIDVTIADGNPHVISSGIVVRPSWCRVGRSKAVMISAVVSGRSTKRVELNTDGHT